MWRMSSVKMELASSEYLQSAIQKEVILSMETYPGNEYGNP